MLHTAIGITYIFFTKYNVRGHGPEYPVKIAK